MIVSLRADVPPDGSAPREVRMVFCLTGGGTFTGVMTVPELRELRVAMGAMLEDIGCTPDMPGLSDKQYQAATFGDRDGFYHVMCGPQRSGKSVSGLRGFFHWVGTHFTDHDFCLAARSGKQWQQVILQELEGFAADNDLGVRRREDYWEVEADDGGVNRFWRVVAGEGKITSAEATGACRRIEGMTFTGSYADDACNLPMILVDTIADRTSVTGGKMVLSVRPEGPYHPLKLKYINAIEAGDKRGEIVEFALPDNPSLSADTVSDMRERWRGQPHEYARRIEGRWSAASGLIYGQFHHHVVGRVPDDVLGTIYRWEVASDWAGSSVTHALLLGRAPDGTVWIVDEWRHDGRTDGEMLTVDQASAMVARLTDGGRRSITSWVIDPSAEGLIVALRGIVRGEVIPGVADVLEGIRVTGRWLEDGRVKFLRGKVPYLMQEMGSYLWDAGAAARGEDRPDKESADGAHGADALRYYCHTREDHEISSRGAQAGAAAA